MDPGSLDPQEQPAPLFNPAYMPTAGDEEWDPMPRFASACLLAGEVCVGVGGITFGVGAVHLWAAVVIAGCVFLGIGVILLLIEYAAVWSQGADAWDKLGDTERRYVRWHGMGGLVALRAWGPDGHSASTETLKISGYVGGLTALAAIAGVVGLFIGITSAVGQTSTPSKPETPVCSSNYYGAPCGAPDVAR